jgi:hypothetical protein
LIISLSPLGSAAVALYSISFKTNWIATNTVTSFVATAFPKMSKASLHNQIDEVKNLFYTYSEHLHIFCRYEYGHFILLNFVLIISGNQYLKRILWLVLT